MFSINYKIVEKNPSVVIYEGGFWMKRDDFDRFKSSPDKYGFDTDEKTRQVTLYFMPPKFTGKG